MLVKFTFTHQLELFARKTKETGAMGQEADRRTSSFDRTDLLSHRIPKEETYLTFISVQSEWQLGCEKEVEKRRRLHQQSTC